jgi:hypothetical protein
MFIESQYVINLPAFVSNKYAIKLHTLEIGLLIVLVIDFILRQTSDLPN